MCGIHFNDFLYQSQLTRLVVLVLLARRKTPSRFCQSFIVVDSQPSLVFHILLNVVTARLHGYLSSGKKCDSTASTKPNTTMLKQNRPNTARIRIIAAII